MGNALGQQIVVDNRGGASKRASKSAVPPGGNGTMSRSGRCGDHSCATAPAEQPSRMQDTNRIACTRNAASADDEPQRSLPATRGRVATPAGALLRFVRIALVAAFLVFLHFFGGGLDALRMLRLLSRELALLIARETAAGLLILDTGIF
jgi:hypothetical protein